MSDSAVNPQLLRIFYGKTAFKGKFSAFALYHPAQIDRIMEYFQDSISGPAATAGTAVLSQVGILTASVTGRGEDERRV